MNILLPTDTFPPGTVGGSAWSAYTLARALIQRGHRVTAVVPTQVARAAYLPPPTERLTVPDDGETSGPGVPTCHYLYHAPSLPFLKNYARHERLWPALAEALATLARRQPGARLLIHAQHVQTSPAAVLAGQRCGAPVVVTVRDHWPWHYFATGLHGDRFPYQHPSPQRPWASWAGLVTELVARLGPLVGVLALPAVPYLARHVQRRAAFLARADAVIAVSHYVADRLRNMGIVPADRLHVIPNMVDIAAIEQLASTPPASPLPEPFLLFVGKLEPNKGAMLLVPIFRALQALQALPGGTSAPLPTLVVAGSGPLQAQLKRELEALRVPVVFRSWVSHDEVVRLMARCRVLLFPSQWGEPLSRVLLEASAAGAPILAMPTGGTAEIIRDGETGVLARTVEVFAARLRWLLDTPTERERLGEQARHAARERFAVEVVEPQVEGVYRRVLER